MREGKPSVNLKCEKYNAPFNQTGPSYKPALSPDTFAAGTRVATNSPEGARLVQAASGMRVKIRGFNCVSVDCDWAVLESVAVGLESQDTHDTHDSKTKLKTDQEYFVDELLLSIDEPVFQEKMKAQTYHKPLKNSQEDHHLI